MPCFGNLVLLFSLVAVTACFHADGSAFNARRVRKELRRLTDTEYKLFIQGMSTLTTVPTAVGRIIFGPLYFDYSELIIRHAVSSYDPRGDQGHFHPCLSTFHRAMLLEFENALLSVVPDLKAMPYWDFTLDRPGGKYFKTSKYIFQPKYAGSKSGDPTLNYTVTDGAFGWRPVLKFESQRFKQYEAIFNGSRTTHLMRGLENSMGNPYVTRLPWGTSKVMNTAFLDLLSPDMSKAMAEASANNTLVNLKKEDYDRCINASAIKNFLQWTLCVDYSAVPSARNQQEAMEFTHQMGISPIMHISPHVMIGGLMESVNHAGDLASTSTSPQDIFIFMAQHANLDRNALMWQANLQAADPTVANKTVMWGYPTSEEQSLVTGRLLSDVINSNAKFTELIPGNFKRSGYTHFDLLDVTRPENIPYTYDNVYGALKTKFKH